MSRPQFINEGASPEAEEMGQMVYTELLEVLPAVYQWTLVTRPMEHEYCHNSIMLYLQRVEYFVWVSGRRQIRPGRIGQEPPYTDAVQHATTAPGGVGIGLVEDSLRRWFAARLDPLRWSLRSTEAQGVAMALIGTAWVHRMLVPNEHES